jgi:tryptophanyl-tRNA synthetase
VRTNIVIADYQVITDRDTTEHIRDNVYNMVMDYLACGIDPEKTMIFTHSAVPFENQLMLPFLSLVTEAEMERNPTVKAEQEASGHALTGLLLTYPVHQACDILFCKGNIVPVGRDQLPHIEITRQDRAPLQRALRQGLPGRRGLLTSDPAHSRPRRPQDEQELRQRHQPEHDGRGDGKAHQEVQDRLRAPHHL